MTGDLTIAELIRKKIKLFKPVELRIANHLLSNYPISGITSITSLSKVTNSSTPSVMRTLKRIGYSSFITFQHDLKEELAKTLETPIEKHNSLARNIPQSHILNTIMNLVINNLRHSLAQISASTFDDVVNLLTDKNNAIHIVGGRITHAFAYYLNTHLEVIRPNVSMFPTNSSIWAHHLLKINKNDIVVIFDIRRYECNLEDIAKLSAKRNAKIILFTDQWLSPIATNAEYIFPIKIEGISAWDSSMAILFFVEAIIVSLEKRLWKNTEKRMHTLEEMFDFTKGFKKYIS